MNKAQRLLIPFVFAAVVWVIPITAHYLNYGIEDVMTRYVLATAPGQLWFLWMLFDVFIIFWLLSDFFYQHHVLGAVVALAFYGVGGLCGSALPNVFQIWTAFTYVVFFWMGFKLRQCGSDVLRKVPLVAWIAADLALLFVLKILPEEEFIYWALRHGCTFLLHITGALMAFVALQRAGDVVNWQDNKAFAFLTRCSMPVYLFHQQIIFICIHWLNGMIDPYLHATVNFVVAMGISLLISAVLLKFKTTTFLVGEKQ